MSDGLTDRRSQPDESKTLFACRHGTRRTFICPKCEEERKPEPLMKDGFTFELLLKRAGITHELLNAGKSDDLFAEILSAMKAIHRGKEALYGNYMETHGNDPTNFALMEHFCDIKRKFVRADGFIKKRMEGNNIDLKEMLDTYSDIAVYGAIGVQLVIHLMEREQNEQK